MKSPLFRKYRPICHPSRGFALVVTLSLMILLTVVAVGMLSLSTISLRASGQERAVEIARDNARLGMLLALGELQKAAGPDQRVTAPANLVDPTASPGITGVWESWKPDPDGSNDHVSRKIRPQTADTPTDGEFVTWLASGNPSQPAAPTSPPNQAGPNPNFVTLISDRQQDGQSIRGVHLSKIKVGTQGAMAWSVSDEGVKARLDLPAEAALADPAQISSRLRAPARPQVETIDAVTSGLRVDAETASKLISMNQSDYQLGGKSALHPYLHDITPYSASLPVNVAEGGIKADLTRAFESSPLPSELAGRHIYSSDSRPYSVADPRFRTLADHYLQYKKPSNLLQLSAPTRYVPYTTDRTGQLVPRLAPLDGALIAPVVTRVSVAFSLVSRAAHGGWPNSIRNVTGDSLRTQMVYLIYTPVVTIYNPYSVPLQFSDLKVTFRNLPVAFRFFRNGQAQTVRPSLLSSFHVSSEGNNNWEDPFSLTVASAPGVSASSPVTLYPGEARVFGVSHQAATRFGSMTNYLWQNDLDSSKTKNVFSGPGWDYRSGYIVDWLRPNVAGRTSDNGSLGVFGVRPTDRINVEVSPAVPGNADGKFSVDFRARVNRRDIPLGIYQYQYGSEPRLKEILENGNHTTIGKVRYPFRRERDWTVSEMTLSNPDGIGIRDWGSVPKQFAIFTLGARSSHDSLYPGKPGRTSSFVQHVLAMDARRTNPALLPMEMSLLPVTTSGANTVGSIDADDMNRAFHFSGATRGNGLVQFISQNMPTSPLVNLADFRHANLASSGHLPLTPLTVGESLASPMVPSDKVKAPSAFGYEVVDHAWLANRSLWDAFYFSGIRDANDARRLFRNDLLPINPRQVALLASGVTTEDAEAAILASEGWSDSAAMMAIKGGFNVNSTSKNAWIAQLNSLRGLEVPVLGPVNIAMSPAGAREVPGTAKDAVFPRLSRSVSDFVNATNSADNQRRWSGFRELNSTEIDQLATSIVEEVRSRGPFLSMAEFINRRLASSSDSMSTAGALEAAIGKSGINNIPMGRNTRFLTEDEARGFGYQNPMVAAGNTEEGASAILNQGDLLSAIGASITVRSDTFVIRSYGEAVQGGKVTARVRCEAVVQRVPSFVDPADAPEKVQAAILASSGRGMADLSEVNQRFGRRFNIISFRWLDDDEV